MLTELFKRLRRNKGGADSGQVKALQGTASPKKASPQGIEARHLARLMKAKHKYDHDIKRTIQKTPMDFGAVQHTALPAEQGGKGYSLDEDDYGTIRRMGNAYGMSTSLSPEIMGFVGGQSFIGYQACAALAQHWFIAKACTLPARDAVRHGYSVNIPGAGEKSQDLVEQIREFDNDRDILGQCRDAVRWCRVYGVRHVLFLVDGVDYAMPFNIDGIKPHSYRGISQIDPYWLTPEMDFSAFTDPMQVNFYEPTYWKLPNGQRIHHSHFVILRTEEVADVLKPTYQFGGVPLPQKMAERVYAAERVANEAPELAMTKRLLVINAEIENYLTDQNEATGRLDAIRDVRDNYGALLQGMDERINQIDTTLTDFDALIMTQWQLACAEANVPATKMLGTSPKGFNATGEHETQSYDDELDSIRTNDMSRIVARHHELYAKSELSAYGEVTIRHSWNKRPPTKEELAELNNKNAQTAQALIMSGVIDPREERDRLMADPDSGYTELADTAGEGFDDEGQVDSITSLLQELNGVNLPEAEND